MDAYHSSQEVKMYYPCRPKNIGLYINTARKTMQQIYTELTKNGRKVILLNGGLFDGAFRPCCWLKVDGRTLHTENWSDWGYGWEHGVLTMDTSVNIARHRNFITCLALIREGIPIVPLSYPTAMGGVRGRTAIGVTADGRTIPWCTLDGSAEACTPEQLRDKMLALGCVSALMLDGGISSRGIFPNGVIPANPNRPYLHNYLVLWLDDEPENPTDEPQCPYSKPTRTLFIGCRGDDVCWIQYKLDKSGFTCDVDGAFGWGTWTAVARFQKANALFPDGIVGAKTLEAFEK